MTVIRAFSECCWCGKNIRNLQSIAVPCNSFTSLNKTFQINLFLQNPPVVMETCVTVTSLFLGGGEGEWWSWAFNSQLLSEFNIKNVWKTIQLTRV